MLVVHCNTLSFYPFVHSYEKLYLKPVYHRSLGGLTNLGACRRRFFSIVIRKDCACVMIAYTLTAWLYIFHCAHGRCSIIIMWLCCMHTCIFMQSNITKTRFHTCFVLHCNTISFYPFVHSYEKLYLKPFYHRPLGGLTNLGACRRKFFEYSNKEALCLCDDCIYTKFVAVYISLCTL